MLKLTVTGWLPVSSEENGYDIAIKAFFIE